MIIMENNNKNKLPKFGKKSYSSSKIRKTITNSTSASQRKSKSTSALPSSSSNSSGKNKLKFKNELHYKVISKNSLLKDIKNTAVNGFVNMKQKINSFSGVIMSIMLIY